MTTTKVSFCTWIWPTLYFRLGQEVACWFQCWTGLIAQVLLAWKWMDLFFKENHLLGSRDWWSSYIVSIANAASKKIGVLIRSLKFHPLGVALYLYKFILQTWMECCYLVWAGAPICYLNILDKLQKRLCRTVVRSFVASLEPFTHCRNVASFNLFCWYCFRRCLLNWLNHLHITSEKVGLLPYVETYLDTFFPWKSQLHLIFSNHTEFKNKNKKLLVICIYKIPL